VTGFDPTWPGCPWGQCAHSPNAHGLDHCHACHCVKPPPPPPAAPLTIDEFNAGEPQELETLELNVCGLCSAYVEDREKHVTWHERITDTMTNLVISISALERQNRKETS
jgi:hypothetical protein